MSILQKLRWALTAVVGLMCFAFYFWLGGGIAWLDKDVFPPRRPSFMPANSVWIDAPANPLGWHNGWWFGCGLSPSGKTNYCRLVSNKQTVFSGEYLSCRTRAAVPEQALKLIPPPKSAEMWVAVEHSLGVVGYAKDDDILLPVAAMDKCDVVRVKSPANH
jgi:hypothetical protein